jgi:hypothetical protein
MGPEALSQTDPDLASAQAEMIVRAENEGYFSAEAMQAHDLDLYNRHLTETFERFPGYNPTAVSPESKAAPDEA